MNRRRAGAVVVTALVLVGLAVPFWPRELGGATTFLVIRGASMAPAIRGGDLALVRRRDGYAVGDVAAYRSATARHVVLHRIVAVEAGSFTFRGDANGFADPEQVPRDRIVGGLDHRLPRAGAGLLWLSRPFNAAVLTLLLALLWWDRRRLVGLLRGRQPEPPAPIVRIADMSFPHELAVADVATPEDVVALGRTYRTPVLYDEAEETVFVVEAGTVFRFCFPEGEAARSPVLARRPPGRTRK